MKHDKAQGDLEYIRGIIRESRTVLVENGSSFIVWGAVVSIGTLLSYLFSRLHLFTAIWIVWIVAVSLGSAIFIVILNKKLGKQGKGSYIGRVYGAAWGGCMIAMMILSVSLTLARGFDLGITLAIIAGFIGTAYLITGSITRYKAMTVLSFAWWAGSVALFFLPSNYSSITMGSMAFAFELVPGIVMYSRNRKKNEDEGL